MKRVFDLAFIAAVAAGFNLYGFVLGDAQTPIAREIPLSTRNYWIRKANEAVVILGKTPCPFAAFGSVIVNHTAGGLGQLVCMGANDVASGNPTLHGKIVIQRVLHTYPRHPRSSELTSFCRRNRCHQQLQCHSDRPPWAFQADR